MKPRLSLNGPRKIKLKIRFKNIKTNKIVFPTLRAEIYFEAKKS